MSTPFPLEEEAQTDTRGEHLVDPNAPLPPKTWGGWGFQERDTPAGVTPGELNSVSLAAPFIYRGLSALGAGAASIEQAAGGAAHAAARAFRSGASYPVDQELAAGFTSIGQKIDADARDRLKALTPDPSTSGAALQTMHGLVKIGYEASTGSLVGAGPAVVGVSEAYDRFRSLRAQGVDENTAAESAGLYGLVNAAGLKVPMSFGTTLATRLASGAAAQVGFGMIDRKADSEILRAGGYTEMADQERSFDMAQMVIDATLGTAFGGVAHLHAPATEHIDAALTANLALRNRKSAPGVATDPAAAGAHVDALNKAIQDLQDGRHVNVAGTGIEDSAFLARGGQENPELAEIIAKELRDSGLLEHTEKLDMLEQALGRKLRGEKEPEPKPSPVPDALDLHNFGLPEIPKTLPEGHELLRPHWDDDNPELQDLSPEREAVRERLIDQPFAGHEPVPEGRQPVAIMMGGGGASGKDTVLAGLRSLGKIPKNAVHLDPDAFKLALPEFEQIRSQKDGRSASVTHAESGLLYRRARQRAADGRYNLVLDRTLGDPQKATEEIAALRKAGYHIKLVGVSVEPEVAVQRAVKRAKRTDRHVPLNDLLKAHKGFSQGFKAYDSLVDESELYDNNGKTPVRIARRQAGESALSVSNPEAYNSFERKGGINAQASTLRQIREVAPGAETETSGGRRGSVLDAGRQGVVSADSGGTASGRAAQRTVSPDHVPGERLETVSTAAGRQIETQHRIAEAADLVTSDNPAFPKELQPRQRGTRAALAAQVREIAGNLQPERLGSSAEADRGAPIVSDKNEVESGNGRVMALRQAYESGRADSYRKFLESQGHDVSGFKQPVLVRERLTPMSSAERQAFAVEANQSATAALSPVEQGAADAQRLDADMLSTLSDKGEVDSMANRTFVRLFLNGIPVGERSALLNPDGSLNQLGIRRVQAAILTKAFGGTAHSNKILGRMLESTDTDQRNILGALLDASPAFARLRQMVDDGIVAPHFDITSHVLGAVDEASKLRESGQSLKEHLAQEDMLTPRDPVADTILQAFYGKDGTRAAPRGKVKEALMGYVDRATAQRLDQGNLFGDAPLSPDELLNATLSERKEEPVAGDLFSKKETAEEPHPAIDLADQAIEANPNLEVVSDDGTVRAAGAKLAADTDAKRTGGLAPKLFKSATDCFLRGAA